MCPRVITGRDRCWFGCGADVDGAGPSKNQARWAVVATRHMCWMDDDAALVCIYLHDVCRFVSIVKCGADCVRHAGYEISCEELWCEVWN